MEERGLQIYTDAIRNAIEAIPQELIVKSEEELRKLVKPSYQNYQFKNYFWDEMARATNTGTRMVARRIYEKMFCRQHFYDRVLKNKELMAWVITPIVEYENKAKAALDKISERYEELINMEITTVKRIKGEDGEYRIIEETDPKKALVLLQTIKNLEERVKGSSIQRQVSVSTNTPETGRGEELALDMKAIENKLEELQKKVNPFERRENVQDKETDGDGKRYDDVPTEARKIVVDEDSRA